MIVFISLCAFFSLACLTWGLLPNASQRKIRRRILSEVQGDRKQPLSLLNPLAKVLKPMNERLPLAGYEGRTGRLLESAGLQLPSGHFLVLQEMGAVVGAGMYWATFGSQGFYPMWLLLFMGGGFLVPAFVVKNRIQARRMTISRDLPEVVDLLTLSVSAGGDFMTALGRIVKEFRPCPVREELAVVLQEVGIGKRRREAMRGFAARLKTPEAATFARTIIQVDRMGTGMAEALDILSEDMRLQRYHWAERFAQQAPMKMLLPLVLSLGAAMVIVAGPIFIKFFRGGLMDAPQMSRMQQAN